MKALSRVFLVFVAIAAAVAAWMFIQVSGGVRSVEAGAAIGQPLADFKLPDLEGKEQTLSAHKGKNTVVLIFANQGCPFSIGAEPALFALHEKYKDKGVVFYAIDSNATNTVEEIKKHVAEKQVPYTVLKDVDNKYADAVGAKVTPETFVVDKNGNLAYHGAPDDRKSPDAAGTTPWLDNALAALTTGKEVDVKEAKTWGCGIKRK